MKIRLGAAIICCVILALASTANAEEISIKIGVLTDLSGPYSDLSGEGSVLATRMAAEDFAAENPGVRVDIVSGDAQNKPDIGSAIAREWYDVKGVDAIVDVVNSGVALAVSQITKERNKVLLATGPATSELTGVSCSPNTIQWTYDTYALSRGTGGALTRTGGDTWFFITADYAFGHALERDTSNVVETSGGKVLGRVRVPVNTADFASYLMQAQSSGAKVVGLANAGADTINAIKQASEFGLTHSKIRLAGMLIALSDVHSLGTNLAQGLVITQAFYWDLNDSTRAWSRRFGERRNGQMPGQVHAGAYSATLHYLKAVSALKSKADGASVVAKMKALATNDPLFGKGWVRVDGRKMHDMYLFEVKRPSESKAEWDLLKLLSTIPAVDAFRPLDNNGCHLVKN